MMRRVINAQNYIHLIIPHKPAKGSYRVRKTFGNNLLNRLSEKTGILCSVII